MSPLCDFSAYAILNSFLFFLQSLKSYFQLLLVKLCLNQRLCQLFYGHSDAVSRCFVRGLFQDSFQFCDFLKGRPNLGDAMSLFFLIYSQLALDLFKVILIPVLLAHVFNDGYALIIEEVINSIAQFFSSFLIGLNLSQLFLSCGLQFLDVRLQQSMDLAIGLKDALTEDLLHLSQGDQVLFQKSKFGLVIDESFPDKFTEIFTECSLAYEDIQTVFSLCVCDSIGFGIIFEVKAVELANFSEAMLRAEGVALIFQLDQLHPDDLQTVFQLVLIEIELYIFLPLFQLALGFFLRMLYAPDLFPIGLIFSLYFNDGKDQFAFGLVLMSVCLNKFLMVFFFCHIFLNIELYGMNLFLQHQNLILNLFDRCSMCGCILLAVPQSFGDIIIECKIAVIPLGISVITIEFFLQVGYLFFDDQNSILFLLLRDWL